MKKIKDYKLFTEALVSQNVTILIEFINFLPVDLPNILEEHMIKSDLGKDGAFYMIMGVYIENFGNKQDILSKIINDDEYADKFFDLLDNKYGQGVIEW